jgi:hypothetical protein
VRANDLQVGVRVEDAAEDQARDRDRGVGRVAEQVRQVVRARRSAPSTISGCRKISAPSDSAAANSAAASDRPGSSRGAGLDLDPAQADRHAALELAHGGAGSAAAPCRWARCAWVRAADLRQLVVPRRCSASTASAGHWVWNRIGEGSSPPGRSAVRP